MIVEYMTREQLITVIAIVVGGVWAVVALYSLFLQQFVVLEAVTPVMLIVAGFLFARKGNGK